MDLRDYKIFIYESCDCGYISDETCNKMITACERVDVSVNNAIISALQGSIESLKELILEPRDYKIKKDIVINLENDTSIYSCSNALTKCINGRNIDIISNHYVTKLINEYKDSDHHTWRDKVHDKIEKNIIPKLNDDLDERNKVYSHIMNNYKENMDIYKIKFKEFPSKYTSFCNEDIKFYNEYIEEVIRKLETCKDIMKKVDEYNLPNYTGIIKTYISTVIKLNVKTVEHCHVIINKTLEYNKKKYESM